MYKKKKKVKWNDDAFEVIDFKIAEGNKLVRKGYCRSNDRLKMKPKKNLLINNNSKQLFPFVSNEVAFKKFRLDQIKNYLETKERFDKIYKQAKAKEKAKQNIFKSNSVIQNIIKKKVNNNTHISHSVLINKSKSNNYLYRK